MSIRELRIHRNVELYCSKDSLEPAVSIIICKNIGFSPFPSLRLFALSFKNSAGSLNFYDLVDLLWLNLEQIIAIAISVRAYAKYHITALLLQKTVK